MGQKVVDVGGLVLCGGASRRMGTPKAWLTVGGETMLARIVSTVKRVLSPVVVVAAPGQDLPELPPDVILTRDPVALRGPLQGLYTGLQSLGKQVEAVFAIGCDAPLLTAEVIWFLAGELGDWEIVAPKGAEFYHPLPGIYRTSVQDRIEALLRENRLSMQGLLKTSRTGAISLKALREVDPALHALRNVNTPEDYLRALEKIDLGEG